MKDQAVVKWLTQPEQPSVRYLALTQLQEMPESDGDVSASRQSIARRGWVQEILGRQKPGGWWEGKEEFYVPKYLSTNWMMLILSDLGLTKENPRVAKASSLWIKRFAKKDGGFGMDSSKKSHLCVVGNTARALVKFGYSEHPAVRSAFVWMVDNSAELGGWSCYGSGRNIDSWEPLSAFAAYPRQKWTRQMKQVVEKGAEFYLERELHIQGDHYEPWYRFHYPIHYYYDLLVGLDFMTALGYGNDKRLGHAIEVLKKKRRPDGKWNLDAVHPDVEGKIDAFYKTHPKHAPTPFALESAGEPSKMVTLRAMMVLKRLRA